MTGEVSLELLSTRLVNTMSVVDSRNTGDVVTRS